MKKHRFLIITLCMGIFFSIAGISKNQEMKNINAFLQNEIETNNTPSVQYSFFTTDSTIFSYSNGSADILNDKNVNSTTRYNLYSVTKTFTALAILQLAEQGKLSLNESASAYLPSFPYSTDITVLQLLNHTSGVPNPMPLNWIHLPDDHSKFDRNTFFSVIFHQHHELRYEPGSRFSYSNLGYILLGQIVENISGQTFEGYVNENIIHRAGISPDDLSFRLDTQAQAKGYQKRWTITNAVLGCFIDKHKFMSSAEGTWKPFRFFYNNGAPYGGMFGTIAGLQQYAQVLLTSDSVLIGEEYKQILFTEAIAGNKPTGMSLSWFKGEIKGHTYYTHAGGGGGYYVELRVYPALGVGSVIMFNRTGLHDERMLDKADSYFITTFRS